MCIRDRDRPSPAPLSDFRLPPRSTDNRIARNYLTAARHIDEDVSGFFFSTGDIYEEAAHVVLDEEEFTGAAARPASALADALAEEDDLYRELNNS